MSAKPEEIHPEHETLTPDNIDDWSEAQIEAWREAQDAQLEAEAQETRKEAQRDTRRAVEALRDGPSKATVTIGGVELTVRGRLTGRSEDLMHGFDGDASDLDHTVGVMADVLAEQILEPAEYTDAAVWRELRQIEGTAYLDDCLMRVLDPVEELDEAMASFRDDDAGDADTEGGG